MHGQQLSLAGHSAVWDEGTGHGLETGHTGSKQSSARRQLQNN